MDFEDQFAAWMNDARGARATDRYRELVLQLGSELRNRYGWKAAAARRLGVHPSYVSKVLNREVGQVGADVLARACDRLGIAPLFFQREGSYRLFPGPQAPAVPEATAKGLREVQRYWRVLGRRANAVRQSQEEGENREQLERLKMLDLARAVLSAPFVVAAQGILMADSPEDARNHASRIIDHVDAVETILEVYARHGND